MYLSLCPQVQLLTTPKLGLLPNPNFPHLPLPRHGFQRPVLRMGARRGNDYGEGGVDVSKSWDVARFVEGLGPVERKVWGCGAVCVLAGVAWFRNLAAAGLVDDTEPLFAEAARQMLVTGDYITPQFNAQPRFDKPILIYWLMALSGKILGPSVWALRLPSAMCATGLLLGLLMTVKQFGVRIDANTEPHESPFTGKHYGPALVTIAAFALNLEVVVWGSTALSDMLLTSTLGGSLLSFFWGYVGHELTPSKHKWGYSASAIFMGLACLAKGPIGIIFPVLVCTLFLLSTGELLEVLVEEMPYWKGILALSIINVPWYGAMAAKHGFTYIYTFFGYHNLERFMQGVNRHGGRPWWYGLAVVAVMYFPWSLSLPQALLQVLSRRQMAKRYQNLPVFAASWLLAGFSLFALSSSQLPSYYLPVAPAIAILAAVNSSTQKKSGLLSRLVPATLFVSLAVGFWFLPAILQTSGDTVAARIGNLISTKHLHRIAVALFGLAGVVTIGIKRAFLPTWAVHATVMACFLGMFLTPVYKLADGVRQAPIRNLAYTAATQQKSGEPLVMVGTRMPSVVYYSKLPTAFFNSPQEASMAIHKEAAPWYVAITERSCGVTSALVITETDPNLFRPSPEILATSGDYKLLRLHRVAKSSPVEEF